MNLKHFYYRGYFDDKRIKLSQPKDKKDREPFEKINEPIFREKNQRLIQTLNISAYSPPNELKTECWKEIQLRVQNPGLLPGIGYPHEVGYAGEFKLGFGFDHVCGLPVLPGSSVKGVLRSVFPQLEHDPEDPRRITTERPDATQKQKIKYIISLLERLNITIPSEHKADNGQALVHALELSIFCGWETSNFGAPAAKMARRPMAKHDIFLDALPINFSDNQLLGRDALTPHGDNPLRNPIPLPFIKVMPGVVFGFYFKLTDTIIANTQNDEASGTPIVTVTVSAEHKRRLFAEILCTVGAGAKTNVGYGQFEATNVADRIPKSARSDVATAPATIEKGAVSTASTTVQPTLTASIKPAKRLSFNKSLKGKKVAGEVINVGAGSVHFRLPEVDGFEGKIEVKVALGLLDRFEVGKRFELEISEVLVEKQIIFAKISNFKPL